MLKYTEKRSRESETILKIDDITTVEHSADSSESHSDDVAWKTPATYHKVKKRGLQRSLSNHFPFTMRAQVKQNDSTDKFFIAPGCSNSEWCSFHQKTVRDLKLNERIVKGMPAQKPKKFVNWNSRHRYLRVTELVKKRQKRLVTQRIDSSTNNGPANLQIFPDQSNANYENTHLLLYDKRDLGHLKENGTEKGMSKLNGQAFSKHQNTVLVNSKALSHNGTRRRYPTYKKVPSSRRNNKTTSSRTATKFSLRKVSSLGRSRNGPFLQGIKGNLIRKGGSTSVNYKQRQTTRYGSAKKISKKHPNGGRNQTLLTRKQIASGYLNPKNSTFRRRSEKNGSRTALPGRKKYIRKYQPKRGDEAKYTAGKTASNRISNSKISDAKRFNKVPSTGRHRKVSGESWEADEPKPTQKRFHFLSGSNGFTSKSRNASRSSWIDGVMDPRDKNFSNKGEIRFYPSQRTAIVPRTRKKLRKKTKPKSLRHSQESTERPKSEDAAAINKTPVSRTYDTVSNKTNTFGKKKERKWKSAEDVQRRPILSASPVKGTIKEVSCQKINSETGSKLAAIK